VTARVLVLGCGPAGLISAQAAEHTGAEVKIISVARPSQLYGCQYLHAPIPDITEGYGERVRYLLNGEAEEYRRKVYGSISVPVSPQKYEGDHFAWDLRASYDRLWHRFANRIVDVRLTPSDIVPMLSDFMPDACISSLPAPVLCQAGDRHSFTSVKCWAIGDAPGRQSVEEDYGYSVPPFTVWCDGTGGTSWYRACNVFGYTTVEWPGHKRKPPLKDVAEFHKPLSTDCDCLPSILRVGRYGRWQKGVLSHEAYDATTRKVKEFS
jgi:hypothetical protein